MSREENASTNYYSVAIARASVWSKQTLTYEGTKEMDSGAIVDVPLGKQRSLGVVLERVEPANDLLEMIKPLTPTGHRLPHETTEFYKWMEYYYPSSGSGHMHKFLPSFIDANTLTRKSSTKAEDQKKLSLGVTLTEEQSQADQTIKHGPNRTIILHGVTGSGKTAVYAQRIIECLNHGSHALLVVPEISLISQLSKSIEKLIEGVSLLSYHSNKTPASNRKTWLQALQSDSPTLFIGTRSSLFLPFSSLGIVIVDEAHEYSLKEEHENSHYHGLMASSALAKIHEAQFIIGSATPPIPETYLMISKGAQLVCLHTIAKREHDHNTHYFVVDLLKLENKTYKGQISKPIQKAIARSLEYDEQTLLFINKLGSAHIIECNDCGWRATCPRCDTNFIYHHDAHDYRCSICGFTKQAANVCEDCGGKLSSKSLAIKSVESEAQKLYPTARIARFDSTNKKSESISELYDEVKKGNYDIIIGTQLMAKGFDFPKLSNVGVINADALLGLPDINTEERLFAQLVQVAGRVGRGHRDGNVYIQTKQADNPIFNLVIKNDWHEVYEKELLRRKKHHYPPDVFLAKITIRGSNEIIAKNRAYQVRKDLDTKIHASEPFQAFYHKRKHNYYWQILCKAKQRDALLELTALRNKYVDIDFDPVTLL